MAKDFEFLITEILCYFQINYSGRNHNNNN